MISPTAASPLPASTQGLTPADLETEDDEAVEAAASARINARRALEENIEILRRGRAL